MARARIGMPDKVASDWTPRTAETINKLFETLYNRTKFFGGSSGVNGLLDLAPAAGDMIVGSSGGVFILLTTPTANQRVLTNNGDTPTWAQVDLPTGVTGALPYANLPALATQHVLGRNAGTTGDTEAVTWAQFMDWVGSAAQGDILYRNATVWTRLPAGTAGQFLETLGASADPAWAAIPPPTTLLQAQSYLEYVPGVTDGSFTNTHGSSGTVTGTTAGVHPAAGSIRTAGSFVQIGTSAAANSTATATSATSGTNKELSFAWDFDISYIIITDASAITGVRYMIGVGVNNENANPVTANWIGFRYDTGVPDTGWVGITYDGTQSTTAQIAAIAANTKYTLRIRKVSGTVFFSVNGGTEVSTSTHVPTNNAYASITLRVTSVGGAVRAFWLSRVWANFGT